MARKPLDRRRRPLAGPRRQTISQADPSEHRVVGTAADVVRRRPGRDHRRPDAVVVDRGGHPGQSSCESPTPSTTNRTAEVSGVLLTTTLQPGVSFVTASQSPDRSGQELAWSLGTLAPFGRASVELTVALPSTTPLQLDAGRYGFRHARRPRGDRLRPGGDAAARLDSRRPARLDAGRQHHRPVHPARGGRARLRPATDLRLPARRDRLRLVRRLAPRRAGHALVERGQRARRRQPGRGPDARLGHPGAVRRRARCPTARPST